MRRMGGGVHAWKDTTHKGFQRAHLSHATRNSCPPLVVFLAPSQHEEPPSWPHYVFTMSAYALGWHLVALVEAGEGVSHVVVVGPDMHGVDVVHCLPEKVLELHNDQVDDRAL